MDNKKSNQERFDDYIKVIKEHGSDIKSDEDSNHTLVFEEYKGVLKYYSIKCNLCGNYVKKTLANTINNKIFRCKPCASKIGGDKNKISFKEAVTRVNDMGSEIRLNLNQKLVEEDWKKVIDKYWFKCTKCDKWFLREYRLFVDRKENICNGCNGIKKWNIISAKNKAKELGSELLNNEWHDVDYLYDFKCIKCGEITQKTFYKFVNRNQRLCNSCICSKGELKIQKLLEIHSISFIPQYKFDDLRGENKQYLKFDFGILDIKNNLKYLIEYQGEQHYFPVDFANKGEDWAKSEFNKGKTRDNKKVQYCNDNNIKLYPVPYWKFDNIEKIIGGLLWEKESLSKY